MTPSEAKPAPGYRGLLALVIILGVLIVLGVIGLIVAAALKAGNRPAADAATTASGYSAALAAPGEKVEQAELDGNRILVTLSGPAGEELVVLDAGSGRVLGRIAIKAKP